MTSLLCVAIPLMSSLPCVAIPLMSSLLCAAIPLMTSLVGVVPRSVWSGLFEYASWRAVLMLGLPAGLHFFEQLCGAERFRCLGGPT